MATINYDYEEEKVLYDSGSIEEKMLDMYKRGQTPTYKDFFYTYIGARENIVNWYPFKENSTILEVGGGLGAVTGCLCKNAKRVVSNEYSRRRAENIYYRHKEKENLEVIVGNFKKIDFKTKFDYIVLIGVFEYARRFYETKNPFEDFLADLKKILKPDGVILIAIENRYGIKYWAGSTEDHYPEKYLGFYGYNTKDIVTFGKQELLNIVNNVGFKHHKFYYPYPDYKMPYIIHTDDRLPLRSEVGSLYIYNHGPQLYNFDYRKVLPGIIDNGQYGFFANSFLVEITNEKNNLSDIIYAKTFWFREDEYNIFTIINDSGEIYKTSINSLSNAHLDKMIDTQTKISKLGLKASSIKKVKDKYYIERIDGVSLTEYIYSLVEKKDKKQVLKEIEKFNNLLLSFSEINNKPKLTSKLAEEYFSKKEAQFLKLGLFDLHMSNIIVKDDAYYIIDQEWISNYSIPKDYMLYFSILYLYDNINNIEELLPKQEVLRKFKINKKEENIYNKMSSFFAEKEFRNNNTNTLKEFMSQNEFKLIDEFYFDNQQQLENNLKKVDSEKAIIFEKSNLISTLNDELISERETLYEKLNERIKENDQISKLNAELMEEKEQLTKEMTNYYTRINDLSSALEKAEENSEELSIQILNIEKSLSMKATKPIRKLSSIIRKFLNKIRKKEN